MNILKYKKCSNCGACYNCCPTKAISVEKARIHYELVVDKSKCIQCEKCLSVCPVNTKVDAMIPIQAYGLWHKTTDVVMRSSSGGLFYGLAKKVLECNGIVYGAAFSNDYKSVLIRSTDEVTLTELMKSKYVESLIGNSFQDVYEKLNQGRTVLFSGTPCQIQGLKKYLQKEYLNLICCDFACGGLPSHKMYQDHLEKLENRYKSRVTCVDFRPKTHGWNRYAIWIQFENGKIYNRLAVLDEYFRAFLYGKYSVREYCLECAFAEKHVADITMADFWKYVSISSLNNASGISLALCNTEKGIQLFNSIKNEYEVEELEVESASYNLKSDQISYAQRMQREKFYNDYEKDGLYKAVDRNIKLSIKKRLKLALSNTLNRRKKWDKEN